MGLRKRDRGQALVEFALVFIIFMGLLAGMVQLGVVLWGSNTLNQAVRDTGRYAATLACSTADTVDAESHFTDLLADSVGPWSNAAVDVAYVDALGAPTTACPDDNSIVVWVKVEATAQAPVFFVWVPSDGKLGSSATFRVEPLP